MDLENGREEEQETRRRKPLQGDNSDLLHNPREDPPPEEVGRYELYQPVLLHEQSQTLPVRSPERVPNSNANHIQL